MRWLVCWSADEGSKRQGGLTMDVARVEPGDSPYAGITHIATLDTAGETVLHILSLKTLLDTICAAE
jgi:hypothetical protein